MTPMLASTVLTLCVVFLSQTVEAVRWHCRQDTCVACEGPRCPQDKASWDDERTCMNNCPEEPLCYLCQPSGCEPGYGMACFGSQNRLKFNTKDECQKQCATATDSGYSLHSLSATALLFVTSLVLNAW